MSCYKLPEVSVLIYVLIATFAISSWIDIVGLWVELPLMVNKLPERWRLPSYMALVIQLANVGPALYSIISKIYSMKSGPRDINSKDIILSFVIISTEIVSMFLMSFFWDSIVIINGESRSIPLFALLCVSSICSCLSSLVFLPYMARYSVNYISAYYFGNGFSGLIPGLVGLAQGLGGEPKCVNMTIPFNDSCPNDTCTGLPQRFKLIPEYPLPKFSVQIYLIFICCLLVASLVSFYCLNYTRLRRFQIDSSKSDKAYTMAINEEATDPDNEKEDKSNKELIEPKFETPKSNYSTHKLVFYLTMVALLNAATNGLIPSIQSYTCLPYGNVVYSLAVRLSSVVGAVSSLSTMFLPRPSEKVVAGLTSVGLGIVCYHFILGLQSPHPILQHNIFGPVLVVLSCLMMSACFSFVRVSAASVLHSFGGRQALLWCGGVTQVGSFLGAMVGFTLVNWTNLFISAKPCSDIL